jgi:Domain of unknown function (DUF4375)
MPDNTPDLYWKYVEPIWDSVSIYDGSTNFIEQFSALTEKEKVLFASHWAQSEIMNGGLGQFFSNSTGVLAPEAVEAFIALDMPKCAKVIGEAMHFFGEVYPREANSRETVFEEFYEKFGKTAIPFEKCENTIAVDIEEENGGFWASANLFANNR